MGPWSWSVAASLPTPHQPLRSPAPLRRTNIPRQARRLPRRPHHRRLRPRSHRHLRTSRPRRRHLHRHPPHPPRRPRHPQKPVRAHLTAPAPAPTPARRREVKALTEISPMARLIARTFLRITEPSISNGSISVVGQVCRRLHIAPMGAP